MPSPTLPPGRGVGKPGFPTPQPPLGAPGAPAGRGMGNPVSPFPNRCWERLAPPQAGVRFDRLTAGGETRFPRIFTSQTLPAGGLFPGRAAVRLSTLTGQESGSSRQPGRLGGQPERTVLNGKVSEGMALANPLRREEHGKPRIPHIPAREATAGYALRRGLRSPNHESQPQLHCSHPRDVEPGIH